MARVSTTGYIWLWNPSTEQWEWNGSTDGLTVAGVDTIVAVDSIGVYGSTDNSNYTIGSCNYFQINSGSRWLYS
jgi:hypothetical protein